MTPIDILRLLVAQHDWSAYHTSEQHYVWHQARRAVEEADRAVVLVPERAA